MIKGSHQPDRQQSRALFERAIQCIPGGVNSPVRAFKAVGGGPLFIREADGAFVTDADGNRFIDYVGSWGPMVLGHRPPVVIEALRQVLERGTSFGAPTDLEVELAELITQAVPSVEMVRMVNSGTEAAMTAIRLARGFTKRDHIIKFNGCYHGHSDSLLVAAGSGVATFGIAGSPGIPDECARLTASIEFNDIGLLEQTIQSIGANNVAAVVLEPIPGNMGLVLPQSGFLQAVRELCSRHDILLVFDEVMTGFRVSFGGAQELFGITPDLSVFSKVIGGGLPVGAFGGRRDIMAQLAPSGPVYQAGTLSGNPLAMTSGLATLRYLRDEDPYPRLQQLGARWVEGMRGAADEAGLAVTVDHCGSMLGMFFRQGPVRNYTEVQQSNVEMFQQYFAGMLAAGIYLAPSAFEAGFISDTHTEELIDDTIAAATAVMSQIT
jgi:glutamate-1-semialdehyde 2,1-aminomutase